MSKAEYNTEKLYLLAKELTDRDPDFPYIREQLFELCQNRELANEIVDQVRSVYYAKKRKSGSAKILIACVLLVVGFALTVLNFHNNESFAFVMYGFTSAGLALLFWGLYDIFG